MIMQYAYTEKFYEHNFAFMNIILKKVIKLNR